ncbi:MAG: HEAT repeat domain-containing protein [Planctomycetales bacterium]
MNRLARWIVPVVWTLALEGVNPSGLTANDGLPGTTPRAAAAKDEKPSPSAEETSDGADPILQTVLERLEKVERELLQLRIKSGAIPADKGDQRVLSLIETPFLGSAYNGGSNQQRFLAVKLLLVNLTDQPVTLKREEVELAVDGQGFPVKDPPQQIQYLGFQLGQQQVQLRTLQMPKELHLVPGASSSTWMLIPELPPGSHVPQLTLKLKFGELLREIDINASQRALLGMKTVRLGPRGSLGMVSLSGALNTINVGSLVEEIDRLAQDKLVRIVIHWEDTGTIADSQLQNWLHNAVMNLGRQQPQFNEAQFPPLPASLKEVHLAAIPSTANSAGVQPGYPAFYYPNVGTNGAGRIHKTQAEAVIAALRTAYESLSRDEVLQTIQTGSPLERAAALAGGGGRLGSDKLPILLQLTEDDDLMLQQAALLALSHFGEPASIERLVACAKQDLPTLSATAVSSLAGSRYAAAHQAVLELLANEPPESKKNIVKILAAYPRPVWSDAIYEFVKDPRSGLNVEALQALVQVGHPRLVPLLQEALQGKDQVLSQAALEVLVGRSDRESEEIALTYTLEQLATSLASPMMLQLLNRVKDRRAVPLLVAQFGKHDNKAAVIQTLALIGDADTGGFLAEKYTQLQGHEKGEVLRALTKLDKLKFRKLAGQALLTQDGSVISYAVQGLQEDGGPEAVQVMIDALENAANNFTWSYLCNALAQAGTPSARTALLKARESENQEKRNYAVNALQQMRQRSPAAQFIYQAQQLTREQNWPEAVEQYNLALQLDPTHSDALAERGHCLLHQEKAAEAGKDFARAVELDPYNSLAVTGWCISLVISEGKAAEAVQKLEESRQRFPRNAMFHYNAACVYGRAVERLQKNEQEPDRESRLAQYQQAALTDLKASIQNGFQDFELMKKDPDLAPFFELPEFRQLLSEPPPPAANRPAKGNRRARAR